MLLTSLVRHTSDCSVSIYPKLATVAVLVILAGTACPNRSQSVEVRRAGSTVILKDRVRSQTVEMWDCYWLHNFSRNWDFLQLFFQWGRRHLMPSHCLHQKLLSYWWSNHCRVLLYTSSLWSNHCRQTLDSLLNITFLHMFRLQCCWMRPFQFAVFSGLSG